MWHSFVIKTIGKLLEDCSFETLSTIYDTVSELDEVQKKHLRYEFGTTTLLEMIQDEYEYRTQCLDCRKEVNLTPSCRL
jgi:hypothetical protein